MDHTRNPYKIISASCQRHKFCVFAWCEVHQVFEHAIKRESEIEDETN